MYILDTRSIQIVYTSSLFSLDSTYSCLSYVLFTRDGVFMMDAQLLFGMSCVLHAARAGGTHRRPGRLERGADCARRQCQLRIQQLTNEMHKCLSKTKIAVLGGQPVTFTCTQPHMHLFVAVCCKVVA